MALAVVLKAYMEQKNIGNKELSKISGVPIRTINNILGGITDNPTLETVKSLAHALDCTLDELAENIKISQPHTVAAHFDGNEYTEEQLERIKAFAAFIKSEENK